MRAISRARSGNSGFKARMALLVLYVVGHPQRIFVVRIFTKKTQKTPRKEIELALARAKEMP
jgi:phage-related protein